MDILAIGIMAGLLQVAGYAFYGTKTLKYDISLESLLIRL